MDNCNSASAMVSEATLQTPPLSAQAIQNALKELHTRCQDLRSGTLANYIPELARMNPDWFSICVSTVEGQQFAVGDSEQLFTIQSISKAFVYGMALEEHGRNRVLSKVGVESTGDAFNAIVLDEASKRPYNPMVNAGAIATTSLITGNGPTEQLNRLLAMFKRYIGHESFINMPTFLSERTTGYRNRAMAYLMQNFGMIDDKLMKRLACTSSSVR